MKKWMTLTLLILVNGIVTAGVPNRIIYQGRLFKSGVGISGEKSIRLTLVKADGKTVVDTKSFSVSLPATGEFTIVWDLEKEIDWRGDQPELKVEVDTDELTPRQQFSASPYAFVAKRVEVGAVDTLSIADGAVTSAKISAGGIEAEKINLANGKTLNSWVAPNGKIMADGIEGELKTTSNHATKHEKGGGDELLLDPSQVDGVLVGRSSYTQVMQATTNSVPVLAVKGLPGSSSKILQIYDSGAVGDTASVPQEQVYFDGDANMVSNRSISAKSVNVAGSVIAGGNFSAGGTVAADSVTGKKVLSVLHDGTTTQHSGSLTWNSLQLGNNVWNYIIAGRTAVGGGFKFIVNNTTNYQHPAVPDGLEAITVKTDGKVGIGNGDPNEQLVVNGRIKDQGGFVTPVGAIIAFGGSVAPSGWLLCNGDSHSKTTYPDLAAVLGDTYGVTATTFQVPDLRGRVGMGAGQGPGLTNRTRGQKFGEEAHTLTISEMPSHNHSLTTVPGYDAGAGYSGGGWFGDPIPQNTSSVGGNAPHNTIPPTLVVNYIIKY
jgi:microcystin-dependent protein